FAAIHFLPNPVDEPFPVFLAHHNDRKFSYLIGLDERKGFKQFVERTKSSGHYDKSLRIPHKHHFSHKEVIKADQFFLVYINVVGLFERQYYVETYRHTAVFAGAFVSGLHYAGSAPGDNTITFIYQ